MQNEHDGFVFQKSDKFNIATVSKRNDRGRYKRQHQRQIPLMATNQHWRNLSAEAKANWNTFAAEFPEPTKTNPGVFLSGYQLFCKRQQYVFLNGGIAEPWMLAPIAPELDEVTVGAKIKYEKHCLDVTQLYIYNFGLLPKAGQYLMIKILPYSTKGGKFYPVYQQTVKVDEVYIDGLFVALSFPSSTKGITFSVYLSYPVSKNNLYQSSKIRYMGCFTVKSFLDLSDTPDSYAGQHGKVVTVKADESGLEFTNPSGGGLTCETLTACPTIITILSRLTTVESIVSIGLNTSIPAVKYGLFYTFFTVVDPRGIAPAGWRVFSRITDYTPITNAYGGINAAGGAIKETGTTHWNSPNTGATNASKLNFKGCGSINYLGAFSSLKAQFNHWAIGSDTSQSAYRLQCTSSTTNYSDYFVLKSQGASVILVKETTTLAEGQSGSMMGNNGRVYRTICVGGKEFTADPLCETKFRDGSDIPFASNSSQWQNPQTPLYAYPNYDPNNV
jgi:hypothetical protein